MGRVIIIATIVLGSWWLAANYDLKRRHADRIAAECDRMDLWRIEAAQGIAEVNRRGVMDAGVVCLGDY
jgi:hypothetical protein